MGGTSVFAWQFSLPLLTAIQDTASTMSFHCIDTQYGIESGACIEAGQCIDAGAAIERTIESLQAERLHYVSRLGAVLERQADGPEIDGFLAQIDAINTTLVRLAASLTRN